MRKCLLSKLTINRALLLTFIPLLALSMLFMLLVMHSSSQNVLNDVALQTMSRNLNLTERYVQSMVHPAQEIGYHLSHHIHQDEGIDDWRLSKLMLDKLKSSPNIYSLYVGRADGSFVLAGWRPLHMQKGADLWFYLKRIEILESKRTVVEVWVDPSDPNNRITLARPDDSYDPRVRPWYQKALTEKSGCWTTPYIFYMTQKAGITYASPIETSAAEITAVVGVDLRLNTLAKFLDENRFTTHSSSFIFTERREILAHPNLVDHLKINEIPTLESMNDPVLTDGFAAYRQSPAYLSGDNFFTVVMTPNGRHDVIFKTINNGAGNRLILGEQVPESDYLASLKGANQKAMLAGGAILIVVISLGALLSRSLTRPITKLSRMANQVKELDFESRLDKGCNFIEIDQTIDSFNAMLQSLESNRQKKEKLTSQLRQSHLDSLYRLAQAAEYKDMDTRGHLNRVAGCSIILAEELGQSEEDIELLRHASILHDVGKISVPDNILLKEGMLTEEEWLVMKNHTVVGGKILENSDSDILKMAQSIALSHHENWDGSGYPYQLSGNEIPLPGRIVAVADIFDALVSKRSYKESYELPKALNILQGFSGSKLDPACLDAFNARIADITALYQMHSAEQQPA